MKRSVVAAVIVCVLCGFAPGQGAAPAQSAAKAKSFDWPQFLGPNQDGTSSEKGLLREWPKEGPPVLWRVPLNRGKAEPSPLDGRGWSCPSVYGGQVFIALRKAKYKANPGYSAPIQEVMLCLDAKDGSEVWRFECEPKSGYYIGRGEDHPIATPAVTEKHVFMLGVMGDMYCLDRKTGAQVWFAYLKDFFPKPLNDEWNGYCMSPIVADGKIMIFRGQDGNHATTPNAGKLQLICLDAETGKVAWTDFDPIRTEVSQGGGHTPVVLDFGKDKCFVFVANRMLMALRASDGKKIWTYDYDSPLKRRGTGIVPLLPIGNFLLEVPDYGLLTLVEVDRRSAPFASRKVWEKPMSEFKCISAYHNLVPCDGYLYGFSGFEAEGNGSLTATWKVNLSLYCIDLKTGKTMWTHPGFRHGVSLIQADGMLFVRDYQTLRLVEATPKGYVEKGKVEKIHSYADENTGFMMGGDWVMPVLSNGRLFIRTPGNELICYDVKDHKSNR